MKYAKICFIAFVIVYSLFAFNAGSFLLNENQRAGVTCLTLAASVVALFINAMNEDEKAVKAKAEAAKAEAAKY